MIYPKKLNSNNSDKLINVLLIATIMVLITCVLINKLITPNINWYSFVLLGFTYVWITVMYSIRRNTNIAAHVLLHLVSVSIIILYIDKSLKFQGWSILIGIPIALIIANFTMLILSIIKYNRYKQYVIYQLLIVLVSINQLILARNSVIELGLLNRISIIVSLISIIISFILSYKEFFKAMYSNFHM